MKTLLGRFKTLTFATFLTLVAATIASAETPYRTEVFGTLGAVQRIRFFGPSENGFAYGGGFGIRPFPVDKPRILRMLGAEFEASAARYSTTNNVTITQGFFTGSVLFHGSIGQVEPYLLLGGGFSRQGGRSHSMGEMGFGAKLFLNSRFSLRPEIRIRAGGILGDFVRETISVGYHW